MKKFLAASIVICIMVSVLAGCVVEDDTHGLSVGTEPAATVGTKGPENNLTTSTPKEDESEPSTTNPGPPPSETVPATTVPATEPTVSAEVTIEESILFEKNGIVVTATGLKETWAGMELKIRIENATEQNIVLSGNEFIINGVVVSAWLYIDVAAGKKTNDTVVFDFDALKVAGIESIATIAGGDVHIYDSDSYETIYTVPFYIETSIAEGHVQETDISGDVIYQTDGITVIAKVMNDEFYGYTVRMLVMSEMDTDIIVSAENISVNDYTVSGWLNDTVYAGSVRYCELALYESELEKNEIEIVETITFTLQFIDSKSYEYIAETDEITLYVTN